MASREQVLTLRSLTPAVTELSGHRQVQGRLEANEPPAASRQLYGAHAAPR